MTIISDVVCFVTITTFVGGGRRRKRRRRGGTFAFCFFDFFLEELLDAKFADAGAGVVDSLTLGTERLLNSLWRCP
jgi:hypothetical protein